MFLEIILALSMALAAPVVSCLVITHRRQAGLTLIGATAGVTSVWLFSIAIVPPLRSIIVALRWAPGWIWTIHATLCVALLAMTVLAPRWIAGAQRRTDETGSAWAHWFTLVTRWAAGLLLVIAATSLQATFAIMVGELNSSGSIVYVSKPDNIPYLSSEDLIRALHAAVLSLIGVSRAAGDDVSLVPGLGLSIAIQTLAVAINLATALSGDPIEEEKNGHDKSVPKE